MTTRTADLGNTRPWRAAHSATARAKTPGVRRSRVAGLLYALFAVTSGFGLKAIEGFEAGDVTHVLARIGADRPLFEFAMVAVAISEFVYLVFALEIYRQFKAVSRTAASLLVAFVATSVPVTMVALGHLVDLLALLDGSQFGMVAHAEGAVGLPILSAEHLQVQATLALYGYDGLILVSCAFWGLWLLPFGWLMFRCGGIAPKIVGVLLALGGIAYVLIFLKTVLSVDFGNPLYGQISSIVLGIPAVAGEVGALLWLLIKGAPARVPERPASIDAA